MKDATFARKFELGVVVVTRTAHEALSQADALQGLVRHMSGDWGELCEQDWQENELALTQGFRLFSSYVAADGTVFWIITEHDRSVTTILLPADY